jgi:hypothetical protein
MKQINQKETTDEIIQETRRIKEALAKSMDFDIDRILEDARQKQKGAGEFFLPQSGKPSNHRVNRTLDSAGSAHEFGTGNRIPVDGVAPVCAKCNGGVELAHL